MSDRPVVLAADGACLRCGGKDGHIGDCDIRGLQMTIDRLRRERDDLKKAFMHACRTALKAEERIKELEWALRAALGVVGLDADGVPLKKGEDK